MIELRRFGIALCIIAMLVVACAPAAASPSTTTPPSAAPAASAAPTVAPSPATVPSASPSTVPSAVASPSSAAACLTLPQTGPAPSDRLVGIEVHGAPGHDTIRFVFGTGSLTPAGPPTETISVATPPFTEGASGRPIALQGKHALQVVFRGMSLQNDVGQPTFTGERGIIVTGAAVNLRQVIIFDESEGQIGWYIGYDTASCISLTHDDNALILAIQDRPG